MLDAFPTAVLTEAMLPGMRGRGSWFPADPKDAERTDQVLRTIPGRAGDPDVEILIYRPRGVEGALPCILHVHGGGYVTGRADGNEIDFIGLQLMVDRKCEIGEQHPCIGGCSQPQPLGQLPEASFFTLIGCRPTREMGDLQCALLSGKNGSSSPFETAMRLDPLG